MIGKRSIEVSVGVFVLIGLVCVAYLTIKLGKMELIGGDYYTVTARFSSITGLKNGAIVETAGVQIGQVVDITLDKETYQAVVRMKIESDMPVYEDAIASVKTSGLIGDKYIKISPGGGLGERLESGGVIIETESSVDLEEIISKYVFGNV